MSSDVGDGIDGQFLPMTPRVFKCIRDEVRTIAEELRSISNSLDSKFTLSDDLEFPAEYELELANDVSFLAERLRVLAQHLWDRHDDRDGLDAARREDDGDDWKKKRHRRGR